MYIYEKFSKILINLKIEKQQELQKAVQDYLKLYEEPPAEIDENTIIEKPTEETIQLKLDLPMKEGLLKINLSVPIIFVINKSDVVTSSQDKKKFEEDSEFIFKHIRKLAITCKFFLIFKMVHLSFTLLQN